MLRNILSVLTLTLTALALPPQARATILPPNDLDTQDGLVDGNISEAQFNQIIDHIADLWKPIAALHGTTLQVSKQWENPTVNAMSIHTASEMRMTFFGGFARRPEITPDAFALTVCHELGHLFGGYTFLHGAVSNDGEADYFSTQACARRVWATMPGATMAMAEQGQAHLQGACDSVWPTAEGRASCYRTTEAAVSLASLLAVLQKTDPPRLDTRDPTEVDETNDRHPHAQCRLDTLFHGALCPVQFDYNVVPGVNASDLESAEAEAGKYSCLQGAYPVGFRPRCWYKPAAGTTQRFGDWPGEGIAARAFGNETSTARSSYWTRPWSKM